MSEFDLADFENIGDEEYVIEIDNPRTREPTGLKVTVAGAFGELARLGDIVMTRKVTEAEKAGIDIKVLDDPDMSPEDPKVIEAAKIQSIAVMAMVKPRVKHWEGMVWNGKDVPYSPAMRNKVFDNIGFYWLANQILEKVGKRANFTKTSSGGSAKGSKGGSDSTGQTGKA